MRSTIPLVAFSLVLLAACACKSNASTSDEQGTTTATSGQAASPSRAAAVPPAPPIPPTPRGLPDPTPAPEGETDTAERVALGARLFFDRRLSESGSYACASCHQPDKGWGDGEQSSKRYDGRRDSRHTPTLYNAAYADAWYWDGRALTLEAQVLDAWTNKVGGDPAAACARLAAVPEYVERFRRAFDEPPTPQNITRALASFVRIATRNGDSPWDRYESSGEEAPISASVRAGFEIFTRKAHCALCHTPPLYTDGGYHNLGVGYASEGPRDSGRGGVSRVSADKGAFKTPTLRGVADHAPYLHDGSAATLEDAVDFMLTGGYGAGDPRLAEGFVPVRLTDQERADLIAFLRSLGSTGGAYEPPTLP